MIRWHANYTKLVTEHLYVPDGNRSYYPQYLAPTKEFRCFQTEVLFVRDDEDNLFIVSTLITAYSDLERMHVKNLTCSAVDETGLAYNSTAFFDFTVRGW